MLRTLTLRRPTEAQTLAQLIISGYPEHRVFAMHGELGAGKTTLIKAFCKVLGVSDQTSSPSFALVNEYRAAKGEPVYHFDLYRLKNAEELEAIGFTEYVDSGHYCFIEWPEIAQALLPPEVLQIRLVESEKGVRTIFLGHEGR